MPFPYAEREKTQMRPALVVSGPLGPAQELLWLLMITSARNSAWPGDVDVGIGHAELGLPVRCYIRTAKIAALSPNDIERKLGRLPPDMLAQVYRLIGDHLASRP